MPFPKDSNELKAAGWEFDNDAVCRGCGEDIEWWRTPAKKPMPFNPMKSGTDKAITHFATCSEADSFRKKR